MMVTSARPNVFKGIEQFVSSADKARASYDPYRYGYGYRLPWHNYRPPWYARARAAVVIKYPNTASIMSKSLLLY